METGLIAIDWGTSSFRAYRLDASGAILDKRVSPAGILSVADRQFAAALRSHIGDWIAAGESRILLSGMVGSRQGWLEAPYVSCPAGIEDLARATVKVPFDEAEVFLIPGVTGFDPQGLPEVMRGEETEAMGVLTSCSGSALLCMPGTHTKWVHLRDGAIASFTTCMSGEVFSALRKCTILGRTMTSGSDVDQAAFLRGVARSSDPGGLLHHLFSVRTLTLMDLLPEADSASFLSGLLLGHEVRSAMPAAAHVHLIGDPHLCALYSQVIDACGGTFQLEEENAGARGLAAIARRISWI